MVLHLQKLRFLRLLEAHHSVVLLLNHLHSVFEEHFILKAKEPLSFQLSLQAILFLDRSYHSLDSRVILFKNREARVVLSCEKLLHDSKGSCFSSGLLADSSSAGSPLERLSFFAF